MELTIGEKLMVLRMRAGLSAKALGEAAFPHLDHPNVKVSRMESGQIKAKTGDVKILLRHLGANYFQIKNKKEVTLDIRLLSAVPEIEPYITMINQAAQLKDSHLIRSTMISFAQNLLNNS